MSCNNKQSCTCGCKALFKSEPIIIEFPLMIKSVSKKDRIIEFEGSCAKSDAEGDVITQKTKATKKIKQNLLRYCR
jgi:hypothetical protein